MKMLKPFIHVPLQPVEEILYRSFIIPTATKQTRQNQSPKFTFRPWMFEAYLKAPWTFNKIYTVTNQIYWFLQRKEKKKEKTTLTRYPLFA